MTRNRRPRISNRMDVDEIRAIPGNAAAFAALEHLFDTKGATSFTGAGASVPLYPLWPQLIERMADKAEGSARPEDIEAWKNDKDLLHAASQFKRAMGEGPFNALLRETFGPKAEGPTFTGLQETLVRLPFRAHVTTNLDPGLLNARVHAHPGIGSAGYDRWDDPTHAARWMDADELRSQHHPILHLHGHYDQPDVIIDRDSFRAAYHDNETFKQLLRQLWNAQRFVFIGFGFSDPYFNHLGDWCANLFRDAAVDPRHVVFIGCDDVRDEARLLNQRRAIQEKYNAQALLYPTCDQGRDHSALLRVLQSFSGGRPPPPPPLPDDMGALRQKYLDAVRGKLTDADGKLRSLEELYVPMHVQAPSDAIKAEKEFARLQDAGEEDLERAENPTAASLAAGRPRLLLLGQPGGGKSTFLRWLFACHAGERLGDRALGLDNLLGDRPDQALRPHWIELRNFADRVPAEAAAGDADRFGEDLGVSLGAGDLLLLDGLDEMPPHRWPALATMVEGLPPDCRVIVTSRLHAFQPGPWTNAGFTTVMLAPLRWEQIGAFVGQWFRGKRERGDDLLRRLENPRHAKMRLLARHPLLLTMMSLVHQGGELPRDREALYRMAVEALFQRGDKARTQRHGLARHMLRLAGRDEDDDALETMEAQLVQLLEHAVFLAHDRHPDPETSANLIPGDFDTALADQAGDLPHVDGAALAVAYKDHTGLVLPHGLDPGAIYTLPHRTLQEYLCARHIVRSWSNGQIAALAQDRSGCWREVLPLAGAVLYRDKPERLNYLVTDLGIMTDPDCDDHARAAFHAGTMLDEAGRPPSPTPAQRATRQNVVRSLLECLRHRNILQETEQLPFRCELGDLLGRLGDPCFSHPPPLLADPEDYFVPVSEDLRMARYPVTNAQYAQFLGQYTDPAAKVFWAEAAGRGFWRPENGFRSRTAPYNWEEWGHHANRAVAGLSWYEALAFVRWLDKTTGDVDWKRGMHIRLPTAKEWEDTVQAAPGADTYPWGTDITPAHANHGESGIGHPSPVGAFPRGVACGIADLGGNVWEWTLSKKDDKTEIDTSDDWRVLKGGAYYSGADDTVCAARVRYPPHHLLYLGVRCVLSPFSSGLC